MLMSACDCALAFEPSTAATIQLTVAPGETIDGVNVIACPEPIVCPSAVQVKVSVVGSSGSKIMALQNSDEEVRIPVFGVMVTLETTGLVLVICNELSAGIPKPMPSVGVTTTFHNSPLLVFDESRIGVVIPEDEPLTNHS